MDVLNDYVWPFASGYCEHMFLRHPDQPLNVYSTLIYPAVAVAIVAKRRDLPGFSAWLIAALLLLVGACSAWWHVAMTPRALLPDLAASAALALVMAFLVMRFVLYWPLWLCGAAIVSLAAGSLALPLHDVVWIARGAVPILPSALVLAIAGMILTIRHSNAGLYLLMASFWLFGGFVLMCLDQPACHVIWTGTHFGWHLLAAATVLTLSRAVAGADIELLDFGRPVPDEDAAPLPPPPGNENELTAEELEKTPHGMPPDRIDPREF